MDSPPPDFATTLHLRRAASGDAAELDWIVARFSPLVEAQVRMYLGDRGTREDAEDIAAEVWITALQKLGSLEEREGRLTPVLVRFLGTTVVHKSNNHLRKLLRRRTSGPVRRVGDEDAAPSMDAHSRLTRGPRTRASGGETRELVGRCLAALPDAKRDVLILRLMEGLSNTDVAERLGVKPNTAAVRYKRALEDLRECLPSRLGEEILGEIA